MKKNKDKMRRKVKARKPARKPVKRPVSKRRSAKVTLELGHRDLVVGLEECIGVTPSLAGSAHIEAPGEAEPFINDEAQEPEPVGEGA